VIDIRTPLRVRFEFWSLTGTPLLNVSLHLLNAEGTTVFNVGSAAKVVPAGLIASECLIPGHLLNDGRYSVRLMVVQDFNVVLFDQEEALRFEVHDYREVNWFGKWGGVIRPQLHFPLNVVKEYSPL
jgi:lipopolysaccharide transport system ATP-binding protein